MDIDIILCYFLCPNLHQNVELKFGLETIVFIFGNFNSFLGKYGTDFLHQNKSLNFSGKAHRNFNL